VACIYDKWQYIFEDPADALNAQRIDGCSRANSIQEPQYSSEGLGEQRQTNQEVLNEVLRQLLQPLTIKHHPGAESGYYNVLCSDG
jgi:hypothetical protein